MICMLTVGLRQKKMSEYIFWDEMWNAPPKPKEESQQEKEIEEV